MPFDPRLLKNDDFDSFPDDEQLEAFGAQLLDDARHLSAVYPACREVPATVVATVAPTHPEQTKSAVALRLISKQPAIWLALACGIVLLLAVASQNAGVFFSAPSTPLPMVVDSTKATSINDKHRISTLSPPPVLAPALTPASFTPIEPQNLTGPEWEAVLDLLESEAGLEQNVSL